MKRTAIYAIVAALGLVLAAACSRDDGSENLPEGQGRSVAVRLADPLPAAGLETPLWLFRREAGTTDGYLLRTAYPSVTDGAVLKLPLAELERYDYRLLMVAQPADAWLAVCGADGAPLAADDAWEAVRLTRSSGAASLDGYWGFADISGSELIARGSVRLTLTRVAGQMLFDFFRTAGSLEQPEGVVSADVESVIDRVSRIRIEYMNPTTSLRFDEQGALIPAAYAAEPLLREISPDAPAFRVALPQAEKGLTVYDETLRGSLRIVGECLLPSDARLRVRLLFDYYDTTPTCGNSHPGAHDASCFTQKQLTLNLPAADATAGLPVASDCYTVSRVGLRCDRIIDVPLSSGVVTDFAWDQTGKNGAL